MDFVRYAERSAELVNAPVEDAASLVDLLRARDWLHDQVVERDAVTLRRFQRELRPVFEASNAGDEVAALNQLNARRARHPVPPCFAGHEPGRFHMHVTRRSSRVAE